MAETNVDATGTVLFQDSDDLSEVNLADTAAKSNQTDYVERGLGITYDSASEEIDIASGHAVVEDGNSAYDLFPDAENNISLPDTNGVNHVFLEHDQSTDDDVGYHVDTEDSAPTTASLKIGEVDTSASAGNEVTELNRDPDITVESADVTDETFIIATRGSDASSIASGNWTNVFDGESEDNRDEFNSSAQFVPDESGWYQISVYGIINPGSDQDILRGRVRDVDNGSTVVGPNIGRTASSGTEWDSVTATVHANLTAGTTYEIQIQDIDSSYGVKAESRGTIKRSVVHP